MSPRLPDGKGLWVRWPRPRASDIPALAGAGVEPLSGGVERQHRAVPGAGRREPAVGEALVAACREHHIRVIPWAFLARGYAAAAAAPLIAAARALGERWVVLDVEGMAWEATGARSELGALLRELRGAGLYVAVTTYGRPWKDLPGWEPLRGADALLLQLGRSYTSSVAALRAAREAFATVGVVAEPPIARKHGIGHAELLEGLVAAMREAGATAHLSSWVLDQYTAPMLEQLGALEIPGRS